MPVNYDTEAWYKLYIRESTEDRLLPVFNRALRDFLLRLAKSRNDATVLNKTESPGEDIARALGAHADEAELVVTYVRSMLEDGFLTHKKGRLFITNFVDAQQARSPGAKRQKTYRDNKKKSRNEKQTRSSDDAHGSRDNTVTGDARITSQKIRSEERRSEESRGESNAQERETHSVSHRDRFGESFESFYPADALQLTDAHRDLCRSRGLDLENEIGKHRSYAQSHKRRCLDWPADFELWLRNARHQGPRGLTPAETPAERRTREQLDRVAALEAEELRAAGGAP